MALNTLQVISGICSQHRILFPEASTSVTSPWFRFCSVMPVPITFLMALGKCPLSLPGEHGAPVSEGVSVLWCGLYRSYSLRLLRSLSECICCPVGFGIGFCILSNRHENFPCHFHLSELDIFGSLYAQFWTRA